MAGRAVGLLLCVLSIVLPFSAASVKDGIDIYSLHVDCKVTSRFAHSTITSKVVNRANESREVTFEVELPKTAFITNFSMTIDGVNYPGTIKEKKAAQEQYDRAISRGQSAGLVKATGRLMEKFEVSVNVAGAAKVTFELIYEELLKRKLGNYQLLLKVKPKQLVKHFQIDVHIFEPQGIRFLETSSTFLTNELSEALTKTVEETTAHVLFKPTIDQQRKAPGLEDSLLDGDLMINYDVKRITSSGDVQIINGYFVHYFAPPEMPVFPKNVVFVIDKSGSMYGKKITQTREALLKILEDISPEDHFNLITFSSTISRWKNSMLKATESNIREAKEFVRSIRDHGATDINGAILNAVTVLKEAEESGILPERSVSMIIMLTDGQPTSGVTGLNQIQDNIRRGINKSYALFCLGFGFDVDYPFLEKMALENGGLARRIYEDSDSALQLQDFYKEVANPVLMQIQLEYPTNSISQITDNNFRQLFDGSEIVVAGQIDDNNVDLFTAEIRAQAHTSDLVYKVEEKIAEKEDTLKQSHYVYGDFIERLWAYLTIQQLLEKVVLKDGANRTELEQKVLQLSLKYSFVTPLTSMVVTKPDQEEQPIVDGDAEATGDSKRGAATGVSNRRKASSSRQSYVANHPGISRGRQNTMNTPSRARGFLDYPTNSRIHGFFDLPMNALIPSRGSAMDVPFWLAPNLPHPPPPRPTQVVRTSTETLRVKKDEYPEFIIRLPIQSTDIYLSIAGEVDSPMNLISDTEKGMWVDGTMKQLGKRRRQFLSYEIRFKDPDATISVSTDIITVDDNGTKTTMNWAPLSPQHVAVSGISISLQDTNLVIEAADKIKLRVSVEGSGTKQFLRFHLMDTSHMSNKVTGLIGQFYSNTTIDSSNEELVTAQETWLTVQGQRMKATKKWNQMPGVNPTDGVPAFSVQLKYP